LNFEPDKHHTFSHIKTRGWRYLTNLLFEQGGIHEGGDVAD
jgi:hypothetical protein